MLSQWTDILRLFADAIFVVLWSYKDKLNANCPRSANGILTLFVFCPLIWNGKSIADNTTFTIEVEQNSLRNTKCDSHKIT